MQAGVCGCAQRLQLLVRQGAGPGVEPVECSAQVGATAGQGQGRGALAAASVGTAGLRQVPAVPGCRALGQMTAWLRTRDTSRSDGELRQRTPLCRACMRDPARGPHSPAAAAASCATSPLRAAATHACCCAIQVRPATSQPASLATPVLLAIPRCPASRICLPG